MTIISDREVPHPVSSSNTDRVQREQIIELDGKRFVCHYWYNASGKFIRVDSKPL